MRILVERPPLFDLIKATFPLAVRPGTLFSWGDIIYNPGNIAIPASLIAHETIHGWRQGADIEGWWRRYLDDPQFRLAEEIPAHIEEYRVICESGGRHERRTGLVSLARRLSGPLYGHLISLDAAKKAIRHDARR